jgi:hypothetical protein
MTYRLYQLRCYVEALSCLALLAFAIFAPVIFTGTKVDGPAVCGRK